MFNELMNEVNKDKKKNIEAKKNVNVNVEVGANKNVNKKAEVDDIEDMLANLWYIIIIQFNLNISSFGHPSAAVLLLLFRVEAVVYLTVYPEEFAHFAAWMPVGALAVS